MLKPITTWNALQRALRAAGKQIWHCVDCDNVWIGSRKQKPKRCSRHSCLASANSPKRESVGRPPLENS